MFKPPLCLCSHVKAQESICFVLYTPLPRAREAEQSRGNKGTCVVKIAFPDLEPKNHIAWGRIVLKPSYHSSRFTRRGGLWGTPDPSPAGKPNKARVMLQAHTSPSILNEPPFRGSLVLRLKQFYPPPVPPTPPCQHLLALESTHKI